MRSTGRKKSANEPKNKNVIASVKNIITNAKNIITSGAKQSSTVDARLDSLVASLLAMTKLRFAPFNATDRVNAGVQGLCVKNTLMFIELMLV